MSQFTQPVTIRQRPGFDLDWLVVTSDLSWEIGEQGSGDVVEIPKGFVTDLASVPRPLWVFIPPHGRHTNASILHDFLYRTADKRGRRWADRQFLDAMRVLEVPEFRARLMWTAVRLFGWHAWRG